MPQWKPEMINQYYQDDIYVEMTFLRTLEEYGLDVSIRQAGIDFANSKYMLWHANKAARDNLRAGIAPPWSSHPKFNSHADDIDYQIEADYAGLISPGMPQACIDLGNLFGRLMNYGDGLYAGQFVSGMYAEAYFETDIDKIIQAGLACIPKESQYYECITDVIKWHQENLEDWQKTWELIEAKYQDNPEYRKFSCSGTESDFNIDAKINGAYIVMGLLYGEGNMDKTIVISTRCGQDSDCNPSNAAGILAASIGFKNLPDKFKSALENNVKFSFTDYNFSELIAVCEKLTRQLVQKYDGKIVNKNGQEYFLIPQKNLLINKSEKCWEVEEVTDDYQYSEEEMTQITVKAPQINEFVKEWKICGPFIKESIETKDLIHHEFLPENSQIEWRKIILGEDGQNKTNLVFHDIFGGENRVAYAKTNIKSNKLQKGYLLLGSDDGVKIWQNGEQIFENNVFRGCNIMDEKIDIKLLKGDNEFLFKVIQGTGGWELTAVVTDENGKAIK